MPTETERSVLHVLPHPGGGGETYVDLLDDMAGYRFERCYLASNSTAKALALARGLTVAARAAKRHDVLHVHGEVASALCLPMLVVRSSLVTLHGLHLVRRMSGFCRAAAAANLRAALRAADQTICVSESEHAELIRAVGPAAARSAVVIRNGVDPAPATTPAERVAIRASLGISPSEMVAIWIGSLDVRKNPLAATRAADNAQVTLLLVGDGPMRADIEREGSEHVKVLGPRPDVGRLLAAADVFVLTSQREGLSFSLLEAMAHGVPPVVTALHENVEAIGEAGVTIRADDDSLSSALRRLAENPSERAQLGKRAFRRVSELFRASEMRARTRALYDDVLAERRRPDHG